MIKFTIKGVEFEIIGNTVTAFENGYGSEPIAYAILNKKMWEVWEWGASDFYAEEDFLDRATYRLANLAAKIIKENGEYL